MLPARLEDGTLGFNLRVGGGLSDGPRMASDIDVFVRPADAVEITRGIAQVFGELGDRENRWTARMRYLVQKIGPEAFREELQKRVSVELTPAGEDLTKQDRKSTRLNSSHANISYAAFCLKKNYVEHSESYNDSLLAGTPTFPLHILFPRPGPLLISLHPAHSYTSFTLLYRMMSFDCRK